MFDEFSYKAYQGSLRMLRGKRENLRFKDVPLKGERSAYFILRHDIDYSPEAALTMAKIEADMGVRASYFLLFSSPHYNLLSEEYCFIPRRLIEMGHEVGLHYDLRCYGFFGMNNLWATLWDEIEKLSKLTGEKVQSISMHEPGSCGEDPFKTCRDLINAYDDPYTKHISYFSDSCGAWSNEAFSAFETDKLPMQFQLLIHPIFWKEVAVDRSSVLEGLLQQKAMNLNRYIQQRKEIWANHPGVIQHENRKKTNQCRN